MNMDFHKLWEMNNAFQQGALVVISNPPIDNKESWRLVSGEWRPAEPIGFEYHLGRTPKDLIGTSTASHRHLLSDRIIRTLSANKFTGWSTYPIRVTGKDGRQIEGYHGFAVTGRSGPPDRSRSQKTEKFKEGSFVEIRGLFFDENTWDGSDIFLCGPHVCVTQVVYEAVTALRPTNIEFTPLDEALGLMKRDAFEKLHAAR
jgi:hypothetical protein